MCRLCAHHVFNAFASFTIASTTRTVFKIVDSYSALCSIFFLFHFDCGEQKHQTSIGKYWSCRAELSEWTTVALRDYNTFSFSANICGPNFYTNNLLISSGKYVRHLSVRGPRIEQMSNLSIKWWIKKLFRTGYCYSCSTSIEKTINIESRAAHIHVRPLRWQTIESGRLAR